jgi:hypothetical protein
MKLLGLLIAYFVGLLIGLGIYATIISVAWHFIAKFW